jgi:predicted secreted protein
VLLSALLALSAQAQNAPVPDVRNVVNLTTSASVEVAQDLLTLTLSTTKEGAEPALVQSEVRQALDAAVAEAKRAVQPGAMEIRIGTISLQPRYGRDSKISGWIGRAELILEGHDFARIGTTAGKAQTMAISNAFFSLSREARLKAEAEVQSAAIERFKARAGEVAKSFGFTAYTLREVSVSGDEQGGNVFRPQMMTMSAKSAMPDSAPMPLESGKSTVQVSVNGAVVLK